MDDEEEEEESKVGGVRYLGATEPRFKFAISILRLDWSDICRNV